LHFDLIFRNGSLDIITKLYNNTIFIDIFNDSTVLFLIVDIIDIEEHVIILNKKWIIGNFDNFIPNI
jgi:hypothetical protein